MNMNEIQSRCFKCNLPLNDDDSMLLGLGRDCEKNIHIAFDRDIELRGAKQISDNNMFLLLSVCSNDNENTMAKTLALQLINLTSGKDLKWSTMRLFFMFCRTLKNHGRDNDVNMIFKALGDVLPNTMAMTFGDASVEAALLDFNEEDNKISFSATTVRKGTEELCHIKGHTRFGNRQWSFPLKSAEAIYPIILLRWPCVTITDSFLKALDFAKTLPIEVKPELVNITSSESYLEVSYPKMIGGGYSMEYNDGKYIYQYMLKDMRAVYCTVKSQEGINYVWLVPSDNVDTAITKIKSLLKDPDVDNTPKPKKKSYR